MDGLESVVPAQPIVKDVQTLKANLKEQEKRTRSENEVKEVIPNSDPENHVVEEQRKRRKVSNPGEINPDPEIILLDGPLPPIQEHNTTKPNSSAPSKTVESSVEPQNQASLATSNLGSPTKVTDTTELLHPPKPAEDQSANSKSKINKSQSEEISNSDVVPEKSVVCDNKSSTNGQKLGTKEPIATILDKKESATKAESNETA